MQDNPNIKCYYDYMREDGVLIPMHEHQKPIFIGVGEIKDTLHSHKGT